MRLYFTDGKKHIGIDTETQTWCDDNSDSEFLFPDQHGIEGYVHNWIPVTTLVLIEIEKEINFNGWDWSPDFDSGLDADMEEENNLSLGIPFA